MQQFPVPAYHLLPLQSYLMATIQFSSGCPYTCEFCDIPELYGRNPRLKSPQQVCAELDAILKAGNPGGVYFVDDNFVGNRKAALELVPHLVEWQKKNGYPLQFACEATLNIAKSEELLALMREAYFATIFCGIETPETAALKAISKSQNLSVPMLCLSGAGGIGPDGHHSGTGHRHRRNCGPCAGVHPSIADPDADHQHFVRPAQDPALAETGKRRTPGAGRKPRVQRQVPAALRSGGGKMALLHHRGISA